MTNAVRNSEIYPCLILSRNTYNKLLRHYSGTITALEKKFHKLVGINELTSVDIGPDFTLNSEFPYTGKIENFMQTILETLLANGCRSADIVIDERPGQCNAPGIESARHVKIIVRNVYLNPEKKP